MTGSTKKRTSNVILRGIFAEIFYGVNNLGIVLYLIKKGVIIEFSAYFLLFACEYLLNYQ